MKVYNQAFHVLPGKTVGIKLLLNIISSNSLARDENKFMLKSPAIIKFSLGKFCNKASTSLLNNSLSPLGGLYVIPIVIGFTVLVTSINKVSKLGEQLQNVSNLGELELINDINPESTSFRLIC